MVTVCICGGGALGHVCAAVLASQTDVSVRVLTRTPDRWNSVVVATDCDGKNFKGSISVCSDDPAVVIPGSDIVFFCLPGFAIKDELLLIRPHLDESTVVGSIVCSTGFFFFAHDVLGEKSKLFGFQRTPFIARIKEYGRAANLLGYKPKVSIATENIRDRESFRSLVERLWVTPTSLLESYYEVSLTNSNPILHTGRLFSMFSQWSGDPYDHNILFYKEWTDEASEILIKMDEEFFCLLRQLNVRSIVPLLEYYESTDATSLTRKIRSITAFEGILSPMKKIEQGWVPDFDSRYFTEDFPFGLKFIYDLARQYEISTPTIDKVYEWGMKKITCG